MVVGAMHNINVLTHNTHLKPLDRLIATIIGKKESRCIAAHDPNEETSEQHMAAFTHGPVAGKDLPKVGMKVGPIATCLA
jgi:hypothetical protein